MPCLHTHPCTLMECPGNFGRSYVGYAPTSLPPPATQEGAAMTPERLAELRTRLAPGTVILRSELREALDEVDRLTEVVRLLQVEPF